MKRRFEADLSTSLRNAKPKLASTALHLGTRELPFDMQLSVLSFLSLCALADVLLVSKGCAKLLERFLERVDKLVLPDVVSPTILHALGAAAQRCTHLQEIRVSELCPLPQSSLQRWLITMLTNNRSSFRRFVQHGWTTHKHMSPAVVSLLLQCPHLRTLHLDPKLPADTVAPILTRGLQLEELHVGIPLDRVDLLDHMSFNRIHTLVLDVSGRYATLDVIGPQVAHIGTVLARLPSLRALSCRLPYATNMSRVIEWLLPGLQRLCLESFHSSAVHVKAPLLEHLNGVTLGGDTELDTLLRSYPLLHSLSAMFSRDLDERRAVQQRFAASLAQGSGQGLIALCLGGGIGPDLVRAIVHHLTHLEEIRLELDGCPTSAVLFVVSGLTRLKTADLQLRDSDDDKKTLKFSTQVGVSSKTLTSLTLRDVTLECLAGLQLPRLVFLKIDSGLHIRAHASTLAQGMPNLETLEFHNVTLEEFTDDSQEVKKPALSALRRLKLIDASSSLRTWSVLMRHAPGLVDLICTRSIPDYRFAHFLRELAQLRLTSLMRFAFEPGPRYEHEADYRSAPLGRQEWSDEAEALVVFIGSAPQLINIELNIPTDEWQQLRQSRFLRTKMDIGGISRM